ncbi:hypothetical protein GF373_15605 [bacterium]|nr:hypothetical protein [bacterium]
MKYSLLILLFSLFIIPPSPNAEKTCFQTASPWRPKLDLRSDVVLVYGMNPSFPTRLQSWRERGYGLHFMTGVAWGGYQDYINGKFDGETHQDEGQVQRNGEMIMHGPTVPYMVPTDSYIAYLKSLIEQAIDEGVTAIHLEEPEFWNRAGYSDGFKQEWQAYYNEPWQPQHASPQATYRSAKLKYHLYFQALKELFAYAKQYSAQKGKPVKCYVPTHTLINYSAWGIVSPESYLAHLPDMDGYIAQVWTGTARTPTIYNGVEKERTFENAYLEYGSMVAMTAPTDREMYFLTDPIEDRPNYTWENYKLNYEATFTAQLMHPTVAKYEVMPWPNRIFFGEYKVEGAEEKQPIPADYATEILVLINALNDMPQSNQPVQGTQGIGVALSDTMMFQRFPTHEGYDDPRLSHFYGMALPLLKHGIPIKLIQMENLLFANTLNGLDTLVMSYANMKPQKPEYHKALVDWVKRGGYLIYCGEDNDPFQTITEWWNQGENDYKAPSAHLFELAGFDPPANTRTFEVGQGLMTVIRENPGAIAANENGGEIIRKHLREIWRGRLQEKNHLYIQRGPYDIAAVLDESINTRPFRVTGPVIDLYNPNLPIIKEKYINPGQRAFLYNLNRNTKKAPCVLAAAARISQEKFENGVYSFTSKSPADTQGILRLLAPKKPTEVMIKNHENETIKKKFEWDPLSKTLVLRYPNHPDGVHIQCRF